MTSEEPGIPVSAAATSPPVQDSAVAMVSLRIRQRSSSERERARGSLPPILVAPNFIIPPCAAPWQADGGACGCGNAFFASGEAEPLAGGGLDCHPRHIQPADLG